MNLRAKLMNNIYYWKQPFSDNRDARRKNSAFYQELKDNF